MKPDYHYIEEVKETGSRMAKSDLIRRRLAGVKAHPVRLPLPEEELARQLEQSLDVMNQLLDSPGRHSAISELREMLRRRAQQK